MSVGDVAGLIAAIAFVLLVGLLAVPLVKLGRVLDETRGAGQGDHRPHGPGARRDRHPVASSNTQLENIDTVTTAAAQVSRERLGAHVAVRRDGRRPDDQGRRVLVRRAQARGRVSPRAPRRSR